MPQDQRLIVADVNGGRYELAQPIGCGGQGTVFRCRNNPRIAVKLCHTARTAHDEALRQRIAMVKRMDLTGVPIARPIAMLERPHVGYVMELIAGVESLATMVRPRETARSVRDWYTQTGGLRRRLRVLHRLARVLADVHGRGLVYGDPSPGNVLVSEDHDTDLVFLIDSDNMRYSTRPDRAVLFTPGYGAPELVGGRSGMNTLTDSHAFAVIAFQLLALAHPLLGDAVLEGEPGAEEAALNGALPWIDHPTDDRNRCRHGIPRRMVLSRLLAAQFETTFNAGLGDPLQRPGMASWVDALENASRVTIACTGCGWSYYYTESSCPACEVARPPYAFANIGVWEVLEGSHGSLCLGPNNRPLSVGAAVGTAEHPLELAAEELLPGSRARGRALVIGVDKDKLIASCHSTDLRLCVAMEPGAPVRELSEDPQSFRFSRAGASLYIHCGDIKARHRVVRVSLHGAGAS